VSKLNSSGSALVYSTYLGGSGNAPFGFGDYANGIAVDSSGNAYVTGVTLSSNFPTTAGAFQTTFGGGRNDAFVSKLNASGSALVYSTYLGGSNNDQGNGILADSSGNAYVTGFTESSNFPTTPGAFQTTLGGVGNAFVSKLNSSGSGLVYSTYLGGGSVDQSHGIALDPLGNAYITGGTESSNFPTTPGVFQTTFGGNQNAFVSKLALATFAGQPGAPNCHGQSVSALAQQYGSLDAVASALDFPNVQALQNAITAFCAG
jgi:Beta-propeller repeat